MTSEPPGSLRRCSARPAGREPASVAAAAVPRRGCPPSAAARAGAPALPTRSRPTRRPAGPRPARRQARPRPALRCARSSGPLAARRLRSDRARAEGRRRGRARGSTPRPEAARPRARSAGRSSSSASRSSRPATAAKSRAALRSGRSVIAGFVRGSSSSRRTTAASPPITAQCRAVRRSRSTRLGSISGRSSSAATTPPAPANAARISGVTPSSSCAFTSAACASLDASPPRRARRPGAGRCDRVVARVDVQPRVGEERRRDGVVALRDREHQRRPAVVVVVPVGIRALREQPRGGGRISVERGAIQRRIATGITRFRARYHRPSITPEPRPA